MQISEWTHKRIRHINIQSSVVPPYVASPISRVDISSYLHLSTSMVTVIIIFYCVCYRCFFELRIFPNPTPQERGLFFASFGGARATPTAVVEEEATSEGVVNSTKQCKTMSLQCQYSARIISFGHCQGVYWAKE
jgi:hypothetical protein